MGEKKYTIDNAHFIAKNKGGYCLSNLYLNSHSKLKWQCQEQHVFLMSLDSIINKNYWCPECGKKKRLNTQ